MGLPDGREEGRLARWRLPMDARPAVLALLVALPLLDAEAQDKKGEVKPLSVAEAEKAVFNRAKAWIKERAADKVLCPLCRDESKRKYGEACKGCQDTRINPTRVDNASWKFLAPSYKKGKKSDEWITANVTGSPEGSYYGHQARWRGGALILSGDLVVRSVVCRDAVWTWITDGRGSPLSVECWVREGEQFYIDYDREGLGDRFLAPHPWLPEGGVFSLVTFRRETRRIQAAGTKADATAIERERLGAEQKKAEDDLRTKAMADLGTIKEVARGAGSSYSVQIDAGPVTVHLAVEARDGESMDQLGQRMAVFKQGDRVVFKGRPSGWSGQLRGQRGGYDDPDRSYEYDRRADRDIGWSISLTRGDVEKMP
jgi:hypothetical protein